MVISDLVTDKEVPRDSVDSDKWCSCIDGALTKENYLESIRKADFKIPRYWKRNYTSKKKAMTELTIIRGKSVAL